MTLFPKPQSIDLSSREISFPRVISAEGACVGSFIEIARVLGIDVRECRDADIVLMLEPAWTRPDEYALELSDRVTLRGKDGDALARGAWTLLSLLTPTHNGYTLPAGSIRDWAYKPLRGIHLYLPPPDAIDEFKRFLTVAARLKYSAVFLEIGGGVFYDSHPEVNRAWMRFCREARAHTGGPQGLQASEAYWKDSTHVELAGGFCLTKAQLREICDYAALLHLEIIPEIQGLSHAYYLTLADRSIAERPFERYPDSYCPSNDRSYTLYEEVASEILEVVRPRRVSIGHDEVRVLGECPLCRKKSGHELLAQDINRLYAFYRQRGIGVMMWGEKLQNFESFKGVPTGGVEIPERVDRYGRRYAMPATYAAIDRIPRDIVMLDWYYSYGGHTEKEFCEKGFSEIFGNFLGSQIAKWDTRSRTPNVMGAEVSTWCVPTEYEIGYNGWFYELAFSAAVLWRDDYCDALRGAFRADAEALLPELRALETDIPPRFDGTPSTLSALCLPEKQDVAGAPLPSPSISADILDRLAENGLASGDVTLGTKADRLVFFHAAENTPARRIQTWFFLDPAPMIPASYAVEYADGLTLRIPVEFPVMTGAYRSEPCYFRPQGDAGNTADIDDDTAALKKRPSPLYAPTDPYRAAAVYFCRAGQFSTADGPRTVYACEWQNPRPDVPVLAVRVVDEEKSPITLKLFGVGAV
ncbi:MAG: family 20 glycosylhydrolase [Clostridiaceae bacterium]|nr:family 20 glycosylhydrolase [Clostridiaceae bacterium]